MTAPRRVLITGAYGLVGSALTRACLDRGDSVTVLRRREQPLSALVLEETEARCAVADGDLLADGLLTRVIEEHDVDTVFHLAAQSIVGAAQRDPVRAFEVNVRGTWLLLDACAAHGVQRVVVASTSQGQDEPRSGDTPLVLRQPYALTKACADLVARSWWHAHGLPVATARCSNVYGGGDRNGSRLVPAAVAAALRGEDPIIDSDGSPRRDFCFVEDAAAAYLAIATALDDPDAGARGTSFNVGSGAAHTVLEVVEFVCATAGSGVQPSLRGNGGGVDQTAVDVGELGAATGWTPTVGIEDGIARTVDWYRRYPQALEPLIAASR